MKTRPAKKLWIMGRVVEASTYSWEMCGIFSTEEKAREACHDEECFVGPARLDDNLAKRHVAWFDTYYPSINGKRLR